MTSIHNGSRSQNVSNSKKSNSTSSSGSSSALHITQDTLASCRETKFFSYHQGASITSLDFDNSGQYLISAGVDKSIQLYDCHKGIHYKDIQSQKYGAHSARFTHEGLDCLYASTPDSSSATENNENSIRYLSLSTNKYIRYFQGHKAQVSNIEVNPINDTFMSSSYDGTVKFWDLKTSSAMGSIGAGQITVAGYDPSGTVVAIGKQPTNIASKVGKLELYNLKTFDKGPFQSVEISCLPKQVWNKLEFSNNGKLILISTDTCEHYILDAFSGRVLAVIRLTYRRDDKWMSTKYPYSGCCSFTPCGKYILVGSPKHIIHIFDLNDLKSDLEKPVVFSRSAEVLKSSHGLPKIVTFNPKLFAFASADSGVSIWQPQENQTS
ncbi:SWD2 [Candida oxycetoniae]|uniref:SWD2 n=1 Tax=Candida oxycetoniae TaxID=497107 RepID=A0AAI9SZ28_9ASCO|nr:SWD2 [Candida oxycetoniae]KAI3405863.2 SWD2 [Candida oxycetoniae]